jgi:hypothetical protein
MALNFRNAGEICLMLTLSAVSHLLRKRLARGTIKTLESVADKSWEIAPGESVVTPPAYFLPNQLERVTGGVFGSEGPRPHMEGGITVQHAPTRGFLITRAQLIDGTLYKNGAAASFLRPRTSRLPRIRVPREIDRAAVYSTAPGIKFFGQWLQDDCATYALAAAEGPPAAVGHDTSLHGAGYENWLGMNPLRLESTYIRELVIFNDIGQNRSKHARCREMTAKLLSHVEVRPHPGVFLLRGLAGARRVLQNEMELAEQLRDKRGFRILDPMKSDVPTIVATCAGAQTVVGVEGSGLIHGILTLAPGGAVLALQPPNRFVGFYKDLTDRDHQRFGFVVGLPEGDSFRIDPVEVERTLDLFPASP